MDVLTHLHKDAVELQGQLGDMGRQIFIILTVHEKLGMCAGNKKGKRQHVKLDQPLVGAVVSSRVASNKTNDKRLFWNDSKSRLTSFVI